MHISSIACKLQALVYNILPPRCGKAMLGVCITDSLRRVLEVQRERFASTGRGLGAFLHSRPRRTTPTAEAHVQHATAATARDFWPRITFAWCLITITQQTHTPREPVWLSGKAVGW